MKSRYTARDCAPASNPTGESIRLAVNSDGLQLFDLETGAHLKTITTPQDVAVMTSYFSQ